MWSVFDRSKTKRQRKPKGQSRIDHPESLATLGTQDTQHTTQKAKKKDEPYESYQKTGCVRMCL